MDRCQAIEYLKTLKSNAIPWCPSDPFDGRTIRQALKVLDGEEVEVASFTDSILGAVLRHGDFELAQWMLDRGVDVRPYYRSLWISVFGFPESVNFLIERGIHQLKHTPNDITPLHCLPLHIDRDIDPTAQRTERCVTLLLAAGIKVNARDINGSTPMHYATDIEYRSAENVEILCKCGGRADIPDNNGRLPIETPLSDRWIDILELILDAKAIDPNIPYGWGSPLLCGLTHRELNPVLLVLLLQVGADPNFSHWGQTPLSRLVFCSSEIANEEGVIGNSWKWRSPDRRGEGIDVIDLLNEFFIAGGDPLSVVGARPVPLIELVLTNSTGRVHPKIFERFKEIQNELTYNATQIRDLITSGAIPNRRWMYGTTLLGSALREEDYDTAQWLIDRGADVNFDIELLVMSLSHQPKAIEFLIARGLNAEWRSSRGKVLLHLIPYHRDPIAEDLIDRTKRTVEVLIESGCDINARDEYGRTPIFGPAIAGSVNSARILLACGADVNAMDDFGFTPLKYSRRQTIPQHRKVAEELVHCGAQS